MARSLRQIEADARLMPEAIREAGRPLPVVRLAEYVRRQGRSQSEKQARMTVEHAERLGLLRRVGKLWELAPMASPAAPRDDRRLDEVRTIIGCAKTLLGFPLSEHTRRVLRDLLGRAEDALGAEGRVSGSSAAASQGSGKGAGSDDDPKIEVRVEDHP